MSISSWEIRGSRDGEAQPSGSRSELIYAVQGAPGEIDTDTEVYAHILAEQPSEKINPLGGANLVRQSIAVEQIGNDTWQATVRFGPKSKKKTEPETGDELTEFDTTGGTHTVTHSKQTIASYSYTMAVEAPDMQQAINVSSSGGKLDVKGTDIVIPALAVTRRKLQPVAVVTDAYVKTLARLTGKKNGDSFIGFAAGELLFMGARGSKRSDEDWDVNYQFAASQNITGLTIGGITGIAKKGWDYLWVFFETEEDTDAACLAPRASFAYVEEIYEDGDFSLIGL